jgi:hypothetical protein
MKFRSGFVSNSSTSSYVITWLPADIVQCVTCLRGHIDPLALLKGSKHLCPGQTEIECDNPARRYAEWQLAFNENDIEIKKLELHPAGEVVVPEGWEMTEDEREEYLTNPHSAKVWQTISALERNNSILKQKMRKLQKLIGEGRSMIWATLYADDPIEDVLVRMEKEKLIYFERDLW